MTYKVYWTTLNCKVNAKEFNKDSMTQALQWCESLRKLKREGNDISFITMVSENSDCVGQMGVDVTDETYNWKKRRA